MVLAVVGALAALVKSQFSSTKIDSKIFRLHYRFTTALFFGGAAFLAATEYFGEPIKCSTKEEVINTYCWILGINTLYSKDSHGKPKHYEAFGSSTTSIGLDHEQDPMFHSYYQWIPLILFIQGCLFYLPHFLWSINEGDHIDSLLQGLQFVKLDEESDERVGKIAKYIVASKGRNSKYCVVYSFFEILNFVNVVGQIFMLDSFFHGGFRNLGSQVVADQYVDVNDRSDVLITVFPRVTKCNFQHFGPSGGIQDNDKICLLPHNMLNEKLFIIIWFWFIILAVITGLHIVIKAGSFISKRLRVMLFDLNDRLKNKKDIIIKIENMSNGDYFLLSHLRMNLKYSIFEQLLQNIVIEDEEVLPDTPMLPLYSQHDIAMDTLDLKKRRF